MSSVEEVVRILRWTPQILCTETQFQVYLLYLFYIYKNTFTHKTPHPRPCVEDSSSAFWTSFTVQGLRLFLQSTLSDFGTLWRAIQSDSSTCCFHSAVYWKGIPFPSTCSCCLFQKLKVFMCMQVFSCFLLCATSLWVPLMLVPECFACQSFVICVEVRVASAGINSSYWQRHGGSLVHSWISLETFGLLCQTCYGEPNIY